nr:MAB_1171c family putative transporter [Kibdelosporangium sp. MJ126-NF4]CEL15372.1 RacC protein [Kibdelosporangium sp. MJ126-NF4]CTQ95589.1 RacC protein [Kibdelosporangium sp. MJ126-NF4]
MLLWGLVAGWLPATRRGPKQRAVWRIFLSFAVIKTVSLPPVAAAVHGAFGANADTLLQHLLAIVAGVNLLCFVAYITGRQPRTYQLLLGLGVALTLITLFALASHGIHGSAEHLLAERETSPAAIAYWMLLEAYLGTVLCTGGLLIWRVSRASPTNLLRVGLWLMCAGAAINALFAVYKSGYILANAAGVRMPTAAVAAVSDAMLPTSGLLIVSGVLLPTWTVVRELIGVHRSMRALAPLWHTMRTTCPQVILYVSERLPSADGVLATARLRLYRRLIEIRDGMLELRQYVSPGITGVALDYLAAQGIHGRQAAVLAEACWIEVALRRKNAGMEPCYGAWPSMPGGADEHEETTWLAEVSTAHHLSPYPRRFDRATPVSSSSRSPAPTL